LEAVENYFKNKFRRTPKRVFSVESDAIDDEFDDIEYHGHVLTDIKEVWFSGCHADVGVGSVENNTTNTLANPSLKWMVNEIIQARTGILFKPDAFAEIKAFDTLTVTLTDPVPRHRPQIPSTFLSAPSNAGSRDKSVESTAGSGFASLPPTPSTAGFTAITTPSSANYNPQKLFVTQSPITELETEDDPVTLESVQEANAREDANAHMYDQLEVQKAWWILEYIPNWQYYQDAKGTWHRGFRWNRGRPRDIHDLNPYFHSTVRMRMESGYSPRAKLLEGAKVEYTD